MKTDFRKLLFLGTQPAKIKNKAAEEEKKQQAEHVEEKLGIISILTMFIDDEDDCHQMQAENLLGFIFDLLDFAKSPQAEAFNFLFNNLDVYYIFKMSLPTFIAINSPVKKQAMKLLH